MISVLLTLSNRSIAGAGDGDFAETLFEQMRDAWSKDVLAQTMRYEVVVRARIGRSLIEERYAGIMGSGGEFRVDRFNAAELANPARPKGFNVAVAIEGSDVVRLNHDEMTTNILGAPQLSPRYSFGIERAAQSAEAVDVSPALATIATVHAVSRHYDVTYSGREERNDRSTFHLHLRPLSDPTTWRLRDVWVDSASFEPVSAIVDGNFSSGPSLGVAWLITFRQAYGACFIESESALASLRLTKKLSYEDVSISFVGVAVSAERPPPLSTLSMPGGTGDLREPNS